MGINKKYLPRGSVTKENINPEMFGFGTDINTDPKDQIILKTLRYTQRRGYAPCPEGGCGACLFANPCLGKDNDERHSILAHLFDGGTLSWEI